MKTKIYLKFISVIVFSILISFGCKKDPVTPPVVIPPATEVNTFVWNALNTYYLWNGLVPGLSDEKYQVKDSLNRMLNKYTDPQALFTSLLYQYEVVDRFSFLVSDTTELSNFFSGTSKTMGYDFMLGRIGTNGDLFGFVRYIVKGSPAEAAGMKRGDIFLKVNNQQLTISNYESLLINSESYSLGFGNIRNNAITDNNRTVSLNAIELQENPINLDTVFVYNNQKIGYLVYNFFNTDFDFQLNNVFGKFKNANIDQLVVDLRYNPGGAETSCVYLASMIYGTDVSKVFATKQYNTAVQNYVVGQYGVEFLTDNFAAAIPASSTTAATPIHSLNMQKVYFIVSDNSASASELLINGLRPYMNVRLVGINTYGKYVGSITIKDVDNNGVAQSAWAMQPIVSKVTNSVGVSDYYNGLTPDIVAEEDIANLLPFGDPNEKLLSYVLSDISGIPIATTALKSAQIGLKKVVDSHDFKPFAHDMYMNPIKIFHP
jgi:C-terminal processing protease CtpA/Prc